MYQRDIDDIAEDIVNALESAAQRTGNDITTIKARVARLGALHDHITNHPEMLGNAEQVTMWLDGGALAIAFDRLWEMRQFRARGY